MIPVDESEGHDKGKRLKGALCDIKLKPNYIGGVILFIACLIQCKHVQLKLI